MKFNKSSVQDSIPQWLWKVCQEFPVRALLSVELRSYQVNFKFHQYSMQEKLPWTTFLLLKQ